MRVAELTVALCPNRQFLGITVYGPKCVINFGEECTGAGNSGARESPEGKNRNAGGQKRKKRKLGEGALHDEHVVVGETMAAKHRRDRQTPKWRERLIDKARRERDAAAARAAHPTPEDGVTRQLMTTAHRQRGSSNGRRLFSATADDGDEMLGLCLYGEGVLYENE